MSNEATPAEGAQEPSSTGESTPETDLGSVIRNSVANAKPTEMADVAKLEDMVENLKKTQGRMSEELGDFRRKETEAATAATSAADSEELAELVYSDPKAFAAAIAAQVEKQVQARIAPVVQPVEQMNVVNTVRDGNALASQLLDDPGTNDYLKALSNDPEALASFEDPRRLRLESALFRRISALHGQQEVDRANPPANPRPEAAGAASPGNETPGTTAAPAAGEPKSFEDGVKAFTEGMRDLGHGRT